MGEPFCVSEMFWYQKFLDNRGITISSTYFVSHRQKSSWANRSVFQKYSGIRLFWIIGVSRFCRLFLSHNAEKFRRGTPVFRKGSGIEKFLDNNYHHFVELFCLTSPIIIVGEPVCVLEIFWFQKFSDISGVFLLSVVFVSQC